MLKPADPNYVAKVANSLAKQNAISTIGGKLVSVDPGHVVLELPYSENLTQQHGFIHAGIITTMLDSAAGYAAFSLMPEEAGVLTVEFKTNLMAPAMGERFRMEGRVVKPGRTLMFCEADAYAINPGSDDKKIATMTATMMVVTGREDVKG